MNLFEMKKHRIRSLWLLLLLLTCSVTVWAQGSSVTGRVSDEKVQSPNQKIPDRKTKCVIKTHINIKQNVIFGAKLKPV